ncbi:hypothetical protein N1708_16515 [Klebsiella pneumoniae]|uniref:hypothetical protein n=1 Tax=Klebsiella pneumoniae TaxID=573 RepID=UPI000E357583|nr:hypothetical protein [Klebsiella pneumoniae]EIW9275101.1 hypothetical protein [Klebsiella pneumoniae]EIX9753921.1 hypothetical protein [Klebsiella pneumoniae]MCM5919941.1 hypothetical protein [Klebsiella pneumoniae]MCU8621318.1 hypothetical protein [Klebsiella pneumoniae]UWT81163.1 hypothetical protein N1708_16515 [Klebsiella pneumoniae]
MKTMYVDMNVSLVERLKNGALATLTVNLASYPDRGDTLIINWMLSGRKITEEVCYIITAQPFFGHSYTISVSFDSSPEAQYRLIQKNTPEAFTPLTDLIRADRKSRLQKKLDASANKLSNKVVFFPASTQAGEIAK